jgi:hypothetical protein
MAVSGMLPVCGGTCVCACGVFAAHTQLTYSAVGLETSRSYTEEVLEILRSSTPFAQQLRTQSSTYVMAAIGRMVESLKLGFLPHLDFFFGHLEQAVRNHLVFFFFFFFIVVILLQSSYLLIVIIVKSSCLLTSRVQILTGPTLVEDDVAVWQRQFSINVDEIEAKRGAINALHSILRELSHTEEGTHHLLPP